MAKKETAKRTLTPFEKLKKRILKEFPKKKLIGDIIITNEEYDLLIDYFKTKYNNLIRSYTHIINDPIFATILVQIGIKHYNGNFWGHVASILGVEKVNPIHQGWIGESFINTLLLNDKIMLDKSERVGNILMHGFVSDYYANEMFDFLFKYYNIDLERDLQRNDAAMMNNFVDIIKRNDNTGRTHMLVKQTASAITANTRGGKIRIRRILRLIDKCFWEQITPVNPVSRLSILFNNWQENSEEFKQQYHKYTNGFTMTKGKKSYSSPYIKCNFITTKFKLVFPTQLIKFEYAEDIRWNIYRQRQCKTMSAVLYHAVTGYKTEEQYINIDSSDIFNEFRIELTHGDNRIKTFKIKADCIRFFDKDGDYLNSDNNLPTGEVYAFTKENETPISHALVENEPLGKLVRSYFEFEYGDIIRLPDSKTISIGKKLEEGLLPRKLLKEAYAVIDNTNLPVYSTPPTVLLKIAEHRAAGTVININNNRYRLFDKETTIVDLGDRSGEKGYIINLSEYGCTRDGIYTIYIDVPSDRTNRFWQFALVDGITYEFEDAPYIFKLRGTIRFNEGLKIHPSSKYTIKNNDENSFNFDISSDMDYIGFEYKTKEITIPLIFNLPVFKWKFDDGEWNVQKPSDIWHSDFPSIVYIKYPEDKIRFSMDEQLGNESELGEQIISYSKSRAKGLFECDVNRFKSWFGREKIIRKVFMDLPNNRPEFASVITQSVVVNHILKGDYEAGTLIGEFDIVGNANYYVDVVLIEANKKLAEKLPIVGDKFQIESTLNSGLYEITVFEDEEDDSGFGVSNYLTIGEFKHNIINPYNLEGKSLEIKHIKNVEYSLSYMQLSRNHIIDNLKLVDIDDKYNYKGRLLIKNSFNNQYVAYDVNVEFYDLNKLQNIYLTYYDGYDYIEFMYDNNSQVIVKKEEEGLRRSVRYRRYDSLYPYEFEYIVTFRDNLAVINQASIISESEFEAACTNSKEHTRVKEKDKRYIKIEDMELSVRTYNCLIRANLITTGAIMECGIERLKKVPFLSSSNIDEIIHKMQEFGFNIKETEALNAKRVGKPAVNDNLEIPLSDLGLTMMVYNCLKKASILTVRDIVQRGIKNLRNVRGLNKHMCKEIADKLQARGIAIR
jgi:hypothetical protein